ncbi:MAG TPA: acyl-CoA dehydrogenase [Candidatus Micrarchaeia archaeon]|nr:acyl-CoA dehydrogenase [Candidatus Micrarchaeia archaeon]
MGDGPEGEEAAAIGAWARLQDLRELGDPAAAGRAAHQLVERGLLDLPRPGAGRTPRRIEALIALGAADCVLARLGEGHADALAILAELGGPDPGAGRLWGVWAAQPPGTAAVEARSDGAGWRLDGLKPYCSGAAACDAALVTAGAADGTRLFAVELRRGGAFALDGSWPAVGMAGSDSRTVRLDGVAAIPVGGPGAYVDRPGFWHGAAGVAACWLGGAVGAARALTGAAAQRELDPHALAHLGAVDGALTAMRAVLLQAGGAFDRDPTDSRGRAALVARRARTAVEAGATEVLARVGRALGAGPLTRDPAHARRIADLTVYLRQSHAERDLADHGRRLLDAGADW